MKLFRPLAGPFGAVVVFALATFVSLVLGINALAAVFGVMTLASAALWFLYDRIDRTAQTQYDVARARRDRFSAFDDDGLMRTYDPLVHGEAQYPRTPLVGDLDTENYSERSRGARVYDALPLFFIFSADWPWIIAGVVALVALVLYALLRRPVSIALRGDRRRAPRDPKSPFHYQTYLGDRKVDEGFIAARRGDTPPVGTPGLNLDRTENPVRNYRND